MWSGISLDEFERNIFLNFYSQKDLELIQGIENATLPQVKKLINKARKIGDYYVVGLLEDIYDELLREPPKQYPPLPPREVIYAQYLQLIEAGWKRLSAEQNSDDIEGALEA